MWFYFDIAAANNSCSEDLCERHVDVDKSHRKKTQQHDTSWSRLFSNQQCFCVGSINCRILQNIMLVKGKEKKLISSLLKDRLTWVLSPERCKNRLRTHPEKPPLIGLGEVSWNKSSVSLLCNMSLCSSFFALP